MPWRSNGLRNWKKLFIILSVHAFVVSSSDERGSWDALHKELMTKVEERHFRSAILRVSDGDESNSAFFLNWIGHMLHHPTEQSVYLAVA